MKSLIKYLANTNFGIIVRNSLNFRPISLKLFKKDYPTTVSDAFLWRTDNGYKTKFKYSDILNLFYKIKDSWVEFHFFSKSNKLIKKEIIKDLNISNEIEINSEYMNNLEDYGTFYVYHFTKNTENLYNQDIISNRCYLGYSQNNNLYSFVHGNALAKFTSIDPKNFFLSNIIRTSFFKNQTYTLQKHFNNFDKNELFFTNPTSQIIKFSLENKNYQLEPNCTLLLEIKSSIISVVSNCLLLRPTVFSYKGEFIDVHHS